MLDELLAQLRHHPDDHATWAVWGDWLLEHGDPRGALIRGDRPLTAAERDRWRGPIAERFVRWRHGFVVEVELPCCMRGARALAALLADDASRLVSSLVIRPRSWHDDEALGKTEDGDGDPLQHVLALELTRLRALAIHHVPIDPDRLVQLPLAITELDLRYTRLTDAQLARLATAPWFPRLRRLHLQGNPLTAASAAHLAPLDLAYLDIRDTGLPAAAFSAVPYLVAYGSRTIAAERAAPGVPPKLAEGLTLSPQRTGRFTSPRFVDKRSLSRTFTKDCERVLGMPNLIVVYVDPDEWTFRTYENILPLDRLLPTAELALDDHRELAHEVHRFTLRGELPAFDELPLYTTPQSTSTRGGKRYIFHAAGLAEALTRAIRVALPELRGFSHVNPVFRCNRFEPGDEPFHRHLDTPYHDAARHQTSQYTLLIYLTSGTGAPTLQIEDLAITSIEAGQCFVFHQAYEHAGAAYADGRKVFLRTELIFEHPELPGDPRIAALFAKACYLTGESVRDAELARDADRAYSAVAAAHWSGVLPPFTAPFVHKRFRGVEWLANGYDYWFPSALPLPDCAALVLLDHFNCRLGGAAFRTLATASTVRDVDPEAFVAALPAPSPLRVLDKGALLPPPEPYDGACCPGHARSAFVPQCSQEVVELYTRAQQFCRTRLEPAPILLLGEEVFLDPSRFQISGNQLHVLSSTRLAPVNFAACWNCHSSPPNFVDVDFTVEALQPLVPPILWEATPATHHLMFDFFRNGWAVGHTTTPVPVPRIRDVDLDTVAQGDTPWLDASEPLAVAPPPGPLFAPFWSRTTSPLIRELFGERPTRT